MAKRETGLYQRAGTQTWFYDFQIRGHRFSGSTGTADRRKAEQIIRAKKDEARRAASVPVAPLTFGEASTRWWHEVGQHCASARPLVRQMAYLQAGIGNTTRLSEITASTIAHMVATRRADGVAAATVNRELTGLLRRILRRAERAWGEKVPSIEWRAHRLKEPHERVRELSKDEEQRVFAHLHPDFHAPVRMAIITGLRKNEICNLKWEHIDWQANTIAIYGKGDKLANIPLSRNVRALLLPLQGRHPVYVFAFNKTSHHANTKGMIPILHYHLGYYWEQARNLAGIGNSRKDRTKGLRFHDLRHTTATRILRQTGNLKLVSRLLRHSTIATTAKYAHVLPDEIAEAMDSVSTIEKKDKAG